MNPPIKALSIRQPWAWLILHQGKDIENRSWKTNFRGRVLIHASAKRCDIEWGIAMEVSLEFIGHRVIPNPEDLHYGGIVGSVEIVDCVKHHESDWFCGEYGFVLRNPEILPFQPCKGALGFFTPSVPSV